MQLHMPARPRVMLLYSSSHAHNMLYALSLTPAGGAFSHQRLSIYFLADRVCKNVHFVTKSRPRVSKNTKNVLF